MVQGTIISVQRCPGYRIPMESLATGKLIANLGLEGDRHARANKRRQILLIEQETLDEFALGIGDVKENFTTTGIELMGLPAGSRLRLGSDAILELTQACEPCQRMEELRPGLREMIRYRRGMLARVVSGGEVRVGDTIALEPMA